MTHVTQPPVGTIADRLLALRHRRFVGREAELALFAGILGQTPPSATVIYVHAPGGTGKTLLLGEYARLAREAGWRAVTVDARNLQLAPSAIVGTLTAAGALAQPVGERLALLLDTCELIGPLEAWLRDELLPRLPSDAIIVLASRNPPDPGWLVRPGWGDITRILPLRNFYPDESRAFLEQRQVPLRFHEEILVSTHGHPLALSLVADAGQDAGRIANPMGDPDIVRALMSQVHRVEPSPDHRRALEISAHARVTTESLLCDGFGADTAHELFRWLGTLSFIDSDGEGLFPHDLVRDVIEADLRWRHPQQFEEIHRLVHHHIVRRIRETTGMEQVRHLHSLMYLHRHNPVWQPYIGDDEYGHNYTTPATPRDAPTILEIVRRHEGEESAATARYWLERTPEAFHFVRGLREQVTGIVARILLHSVTPADLDADPAVGLLVAHHNAIAPGKAIGLIRFAMGNETYRNPSTPMSISVLGAAAAYCRTDLAVTSMVVSEPAYWNEHFAYIRHSPWPGGAFRVGEREFTIYSHDWREEPIEQFDDILTRQEISTSIQPAPPPSRAVVALSRTEFTESVRRALRGGLVPARVRDNPLLRSGLVLHRNDPSPAPEFLCAAIRDAAETLRRNGRTERYYRALERTYLDPAPTQEQAAEDLNLPFSTYRRHLTTGIDLLTDELWHRELRATAG